jgi:hypothetical protein
MEYRFLKDGDTGFPHCDAHNVTEREVIQVLRHSSERLRRKDGVLVAQGQTEAGRYLQVIYREYPEEDYIFVITAYDLVGKAKHAYRRRHRHR